MKRTQFGLKTTIKQPSIDDFETQRCQDGTGKRTYFSPLRFQGESVGKPRLQGYCIRHFTTEHRLALAGVDGAAAFPCFLLIPHRFGILQALRYEGVLACLRAGLTNQINKAAGPGQGGGGCPPRSFQVFPLSAPTP